MVQQIRTNSGRNRATQIDTYQNRRSPSGTFTRPRLDDTNIKNAQKIVRYANDVLDEKAKQDGFEAGVEAQNKALAEGLNYIEAENQYTIAGSNFQKGANSAFLSGVQRKIRKDYSALETQYNGSTIENPIPNVQGFNEEALKLRQDIISSVPSALQPEVANYLDSTIASKYNAIEGADLRYKKEEYTSDLYENTTDNLIELETMLVQYGTNLENPVWNDIVELSSNVLNDIASLDEYLSPSKANELRESYFLTLKYAGIRNGYKNAQELFGLSKQEYIADIRAGGEAYQQVMDNINDVFGETAVEILGTDDGVGRSLTIKEQQAISSELQTTYNTDRKLLETDYSKEYKRFENAMALEIEGKSGGYEFSRDKWASLGRTEDEIDALQKIYDDTIRVGTFIKETKTYDFTQHDDAITKTQNAVDEFEIQLDTGKDLDGNDLTELELAELAEEQLFTISVLDSLKKEKARKNELINKNDGSDWQILTDAGVEFSFNSPAEIEDALAKKLQYTGVNVWETQMLPKETLETIENRINNMSFDMMFINYEGTGAGYFEILNQQFGKYLPTLLKDLELDKSEMKQVITFMATDINTARSIYIGMEKGAEIKNDFEGTLISKDIADLNAQITTEYEDALASNTELYSSLRQGMNALYLAKRADGLNHTQALEFTKKKFNDQYQKVTLSVNSQTLLVPKAFEDAFPIDLIQTQTTNFFNNIQDYQVYPYGEGYSLKDIVDNKDDYRFVIQGNEIYLVPKETGIAFPLPVLQKSSSGANNDVFSAPHFDTSNSQVTMTETHNTTTSQSYTKAEDTNKKILAEIGETKITKGTEKTGAGGRKDRREGNLTDVVVDMNAEDKVEKLRIIFERDIGLNNYNDEDAAVYGFDKEQKRKAHAISFFIKDGDMETWILDWLKDNAEGFDELLSTPGIQNAIMEGWQNNFNRIYISGNKMDPLRALHSYIKETVTSMQSTISSTADIDNSATLSDGEILLQGEAAMEGLGLTEMDLTPDLDIQR